MKIVKKKLSELNIAPYNPRVDIMKDNVFYQKLYSSIKKFGYVEPIIWNKQTGNIVGGNQRLAVLIDTGMPGEEIDCVEVDLSLNDEKALNVALNKISGDWDHDKLAMVFNDLKLEDYELDFTGFDSKEIDSILDEFNTIPDEEADVDALVERESKYKVQRGDIYTLGSHRLMCGDSTDSGDVKRLMDNNNNCQLMITDPPYNVNYSSKNELLNLYDKGNAVQTPLENHFLSEQEYMDFTQKWMETSLDILSDYNSVYVFGNYESLIQHYQSQRLIVSNMLVWKKNCIVLGRMDYKCQHEFILYGWKKHHKWYGGNNASTIIEYNKPSHNKLHPTMKPIELLTELIHNSSLHNNNIYDPFGGSGSTLIACEQTNRSCYMMEIDPHYCSVIIERWEQLTGGRHEQWEAN